MSKYDTVDDVTVEWINKIIESFYNLSGCNIQPILYTAKKTTKGKFEIVKLSKPNPLNKHIYSMYNGNELDYILTIYSDVFFALDDNDKELSIRHALEYADVDIDKDNPYNLRNAEIESFYDEIEKTKDDPLWQQRIQSIAQSVYEKE